MNPWSLLEVLILVALALVITVFASAAIESPTLEVIAKGVFTPKASSLVGIDLVTER